jgi:hypothetical protein
VATLGDAIPEFRSWGAFAWCDLDGDMGDRRGEDGTDTFWDVAEHPLLSEPTYSLSFGWSPVATIDLLLVEEVDEAVVELVPVKVLAVLGSGREVGLEAIGNLLTEQLLHLVDGDLIDEADIAGSVDVDGSREPASRIVPYPLSGGSLVHCVYEVG